MGAKGVGERRLEDRQHVLGGSGEAQGEVALGVARLHQGADDQLAVSLGDPRRRHADRPRNLDDTLLGQAGVAERLDSPRLLQLGLGQRALVGVRIGDAERCRGSLQQVQVDAGELGDLARRVARAVAGQGALHRQQGEAPPVDRLAQLLERDAFAGEALEQLPPCLARLALDSVEQPLRLEIDHRRILPPGDVPVVEYPYRPLITGTSLRRWLRRRRGADRRRR